MKKTLKVCLDQLGDYCSFTLNNKDSVIQLEKIWLEPKTKEDYDWSLAINNALIHLLYRNTKIISDKEFTFSTKSEYFYPKISPQQKDPVIFLNKVISASPEMDINSVEQYYNLIEVSLVPQKGIAPFNLYLDIVFDEKQVSVLEKTNETPNQKEIRAKARQVETPFDNHHDIFWLCKNLKSNDISEFDMQLDVLNQLKETLIYQRMFDS